MATLRRDTYEVGFDDAELSAGLRSAAADIRGFQSTADKSVGDAGGTAASAFKGGLVGGLVGGELASIFNTVFGRAFEVLEENEAVVRAQDAVTDVIKELLPLLEALLDGVVIPLLHGIRDFLRQNESVIERLAGVVLRVFTILADTFLPIVTAYIEAVFIPLLESVLVIFEALGLTSQQAGKDIETSFTSAGESVQEFVDEQESDIDALGIAWNAFGDLFSKGVAGWTVALATFAGIIVLVRKAFVLLWQAAKAVAGAVRAIINWKQLLARVLRRVDIGLFRLGQRFPFLKTQIDALRAPLRDLRRRLGRIERPRVGQLRFNIDAPKPDSFVKRLWDGIRTAWGNRWEAFREWWSRTFKWERIFSNEGARITGRNLARLLWSAFTTLIRNSIRKFKFVIPLAAFALGFLPESWRKWLYDNLVAPWKAIWEEGVRVLQDEGFLGLLEWIAVTFWNGLKAIWNGIFNNLLSPVLGWLQAPWTAFSEWVEDVFGIDIEAVFKGIIDAVIALFKGLRDDALGFIGEIIAKINDFVTFEIPKFKLPDLRFPDIPIPNIDLPKVPGITSSVVTPLPSFPSTGATVVVNNPVFTDSINQQEVFQRLARDVDSYYT